MKKFLDPRSLADAEAYTVEQILRRQHGVIHRQQALQTGMTRGEIDTKVRRGHWHRILPCILATSPQPAPMGRVWAAMLWGGNGTIIAGRAAYAAEGVIEEVPPIIDVFVHVRRGRKDPPGIRSRRTPVPRTHYTWRAGVRYTIPGRTALDLARWGHTDPGLPMLLRRNATNPDQIRYLLQRMTTLRGYARACRVVERAMTNPWSPPEQDLHGGLRDDGITGWKANIPVLWTEITEILPDVSFDEIKLAVEVEGKQYHSEAVDPAAFERDARRRQYLLDSGWFVLRFTAKQIEQDLPGVVATIRAKVTQLATLYGLPAETFGL